MGWIILSVVSQYGSDAKVLAPWSIGTFIYAIFLVLIVGAAIVLIYFIVTKVKETHFKSSGLSVFDEKIKHLDLTHEECFCLRTKLHQLNYDNPTIILKNEVDYDRFLQKIEKNMTYHEKLLLQAIREKIFH